MLWLTIPGRFAEAAALAERLLAGTPPLAGGSAAQTCFALAVAAAALGRPGEARRLYEEARTAAEASGEYWLVGITAFSQLLHLELPYRADRPGERVRVAREGAAGWRRASGVLGADASPDLASLPLLVVEGRWAEARALALAVRAARGVNVQFALGLLGPLARERGEAALAWELVRETLPDGPGAAPGDAWFLAATALQRVAALLSLDAGNLAAARAWLEAHDRWLTWSGAVLGQAEGQLSWAGYHRAAGDLAPAREHAERALARASEPRQPLALLAAHRLLGELDTSARRYADAAHHLDESLALAEACAAPYERALTLLALAELRAAAGAAPEAQAPLNEARAILAPLEARPALARAEALAAKLAAAGPAPAGAPVRAYPAGLTAREVEVLRLVAHGLTDAQVAEQLFVSPHTVNAHLRSIYSKLGVSSRSAATRFALEQGLT